MGDEFNEEDMQAEQGEVEQQVGVEPPVAVKRPAEDSHNLVSRTITQRH